MAVQPSTSHMTLSSVLYWSSLSDLPLLYITLSVPVPPAAMFKKKKPRNITPGQTRIIRLMRHYRLMNSASDVVHHESDTPTVTWI